jgi:ribonuclease VapC
MSKTYILDSYAILALLRKEAGGDEVSRLLREGQEGKLHLLMTWVNLGEVAYIVQRRWGLGRVYQVLAALEATEVEVVPIEQELALAAAQIKAAYPLAYADAFAAALATRETAPLVTGNVEFRTLEGAISIHWLPKEE